MALAVIQAVGDESTANSEENSVTVTSTTAGSLLAISVGNDSNRTVDSITCGTDTPVQATGARAVRAAGTYVTDVYYVLSCASGTTTVTVNFSGAAGTFKKMLHIVEVSGFTTCEFDLADNADNQTGSGADCAGAAIVTTGDVGFAVGVIKVNNGVSASPKAGNEFDDGGDIMDQWGVCSLISATAASHQPVWTSGSEQGYCASTAAWKEGEAPTVDTGTAVIHALTVHTPRVIG